MTSCKNQKQGGFTIMELLVTVALMTLFFTIGYVSIGEIQKQTKLRRASDEIRSMLRWARESSVARKDGHAYIVGEAGGVVVVRDETGQIYQRYQMPEGVIVIPASFAYAFLATDGSVPGCPCEILLEYSDEQYLVGIGELGIVK